MASRAGRVACRASTVRAAVLRNKVLALAQASSIGLRSGEPDGRQRQVTPAPSSSARTALVWWAPGSSMASTASGLTRGSSGRRTCLRQAWNAAPSAAAAMLVAPTMPASPSAPRMVTRSQRPHGAMPKARSPHGLQPCRRTRLVSAPPSSRKTRRSARTVEASARQAARARPRPARRRASSSSLRVRPRRRRVRPSVQGWTRIPLASASHRGLQPGSGGRRRPPGGRSAASPPSWIIGGGPPRMGLATSRPSLAAVSTQRCTVERLTGTRRATASRDRLPRPAPPRPPSDADPLSRLWA